MTKRCPVRPAKVMELKAFFADYEGRSPRDKLYYLFREKQYRSIGFGVSVYELALSLYPDDVITRKGVIEPARQAIEAVRRYLNILRNWLVNRSLLPYACSNEKGESLLFNQNQESIPIVEQKMAVIENKLKDRRRKIIKIATIPEKERQIIAKQDDKIIEQLFLKALKRRKKLTLIA